MFVALAKGSAAFAVVLPLAAAAVIPAPRPAGLICSDGKPSGAVCQAADTGANRVADISDAIDSSGSPKAPNSPQPGK
jgi:hypothetical protein